MRFMGFKSKMTELKEDQKKKHLNMNIIPMRLLTMFLLCHLSDMSAAPSFGFIEFLSISPTTYFIDNPNRCIIMIIYQTPGSSYIAWAKYKI